MTTRERVLIWAMSGAVVYVAASLGLGSMRGTIGSAMAKRQMDELRLFADGQWAKLLPLRLKAKEKLALDQASGEWAKSPFIDRVAETRSLQGRAQRFAYTGFIQAGDQRFAIVNGREYRVSDPVGTGDFLVESIQPDQVVLISRSGGRRMTIALQSFKSRKESP